MYPAGLAGACRHLDQPTCRTLWQTTSAPSPPPPLLTHCCGNDELCRGQQAMSELLPLTQLRAGAERARTKACQWPACECLLPLTQLRAGAQQALTD